ncbi:MAG: hypothetical protein OXU75_14510 [Deltaproteobacteria bacterium]|nr:hypothetical protein [Deltaproteobacteria bacterium]
MEIDAAHLTGALAKIGHAVIGYAVVIGMFTAAARLGQYTMSPNLDEANSIVKEAAESKSEDVAVITARYQLGGQILRNATVKQIVAVTLGVLSAILL